MEARTEFCFDDDLARGIRRARQASGMGFRDAARRAELDHSSIWRIENGVIVPTLETLVRLMKLYGANLNIGPDGVMITWLAAPEKETT